MTDPNTFPKWGDTPRLEKLHMIVTEKIDGTNALIAIGPAVPDHAPLIAMVDGLRIAAGSRTRWISTDADNHGFAVWVREHAEHLVSNLKRGLHYGEWWGSGIQRRYGLSEKRFSHFDGRVPQTEHIHTVPNLYTGPLDIAQVKSCMEGLRAQGSQAAPGWMQPEGVIVTILGGSRAQRFKCTFDGPKWALPKVAA